MGSLNVNISNGHIEIDKYRGENICIRNNKGIFNINVY